MKGLGGVMMETTEDHSSDEKASNECRGGRNAEEGTGDTGGGGAESDGSFCCVRSSSVRRALIGREFCAVAGAELCKNDTDTCQILLLLFFPAAHSQGRIALGCQAEIPPISSARDSGAGMLGAPSHTTSKLLHTYTAR